MSNPTHALFENIANKLFAQAGVSKFDRSKEYQDCCNILSAQMAQLSVAQAMGDITFDERVEFYEKQKAALVQDLREMTSNARAEGDDAGA